MSSQYIFTLESLIAWLETKPRDEEYDYGDDCNCMFAQYLKHHGHTGVSVAGYGDWYSNQGKGCWPTQNLVALSASSGWTFGDALDRARWEIRQQRSPL